MNSKKVPVKMLVVVFFVVVLVATTVYLVGSSKAFRPASDSTLIPRDFDLPTPLFASNSAWRQRASSASVLASNDQQILTLYRALLGDTTDFSSGTGMDTAWPFIDVTYDDYSVAIFQAGNGGQDVTMLDYTRSATANNAKISANTDGTVTIQNAASSIRPAGPESADADGHVVIYNPDNSVEYDIWQATTSSRRRGGQTGSTISSAGVVDVFDTTGAGANPDSYYSARATGAPLLAGLLLPEDVESGTIAHALAFSIPGPRNTSVDPSSPSSGDYSYPMATTETDFYSTNPDALAPGQRIRLKQSLVDTDNDSINEDQLSPITQMFLATLRTYGGYVADNAGGFTFYSEDIHTANLDMTNAEVNALIGQPAGTALPAGKTKWQVVMEKLNEEMETIPLASGDYEGQNASMATYTTANFEIVSSAATAGYDNSTNTIDDYVSAAASASLITGAGPGGGPHIRSFTTSGVAETDPNKLFAYAEDYRGGV
ncbi:MAG: hypothetical protein HQ530_03435, partial [Parcubacteria group bacterium]|nr:hypothetical protein [Parcubacteria group bacterium]